MTEKTNEWLIKSLGEPDNSIEDHSYEIRPLTVEGKQEWWMFHNGVGSGEPLAQWLEEYAAQQSPKLSPKMPTDIKFPTREEIKAHFTTTHKPWKEEPYRKINYDRVTGAEWAFEWLRNQIEKR